MHGICQPSPYHGRFVYRGMYFAPNGWPNPYNQYYWPTYPNPYATNVRSPQPPNGPRPAAFDPQVACAVPGCAVLFRSSKIQDLYFCSAEHQQLYPSLPLCKNPSCGKRIQPSVVPFCGNDCQSQWFQDSPKCALANCYEHAEYDSHRRQHNACCSRSHERRYRNYPAYTGLFLVKLLLKLFRNSSIHQAQQRRSKIS